MPESTLHLHGRITALRQSLREIAQVAIMASHDVKPELDAIDEIEGIAAAALANDDTPKLDRLDAAIERKLEEVTFTGDQHCLVCDAPHRSHPITCAEARSAYERTQGQLVRLERGARRG